MRLFKRKYEKKHYFRKYSLLHKIINFSHPILQHDENSPVKLMPALNNTSDFIFHIDIQHVHKPYRGGR